MDYSVEGVIHVDSDSEATDPPLDFFDDVEFSSPRLRDSYMEIERRVRRLEAVLREAQGAAEAHVAAARVGGSGTEGAGMTSVEYLGILAATGEECGGSGSTNLVAKALAENGDDDSTASRSFFDCNICWDVARDPIVTCCGHLFCWPCFYQVSLIDIGMRECPVCRGEVKNASITPIYGNETAVGKSSEPEESSSRAPPRPGAHRVEGVRQQHLRSTTGMFPIEQVMLTFGSRFTASALGQMTQQNTSSEPSVHREDTSQVSQPSAEVGSQSQHDFSPFDRISSGMHGILGPVIGVGVPIREQSPSVGDRDSVSSVFAVLHSGSQTIDTTGQQASPSSRRNDVSAAAEDSQNLVTPSPEVGISPVPLSPLVLRTGTLASRSNRSDVPAEGTESHIVTASPSDTALGGVGRLRAYASRRRARGNSRVEPGASHESRRRRLR